MGGPEGTGDGGTGGNSGGITDGGSTGGNNGGTTGGNGGNNGNAGGNNNGGNTGGNAGGNNGGGGNSNAAAAGTVHPDGSFTLTDITLDEAAAIQNATVRMMVHNGPGNSLVKIADVGTISGGKLSLTLPAELPAELPPGADGFFRTFTDGEYGYTVNPSPVRYFWLSTLYVYSGETELGVIMVNNASGARLDYYFFEAAATITSTGGLSYSINAAKGWNRVLNTVGQPGISNTTDMSKAPADLVVSFYGTGGGGGAGGPELLPYGWETMNFAQWDYWYNNSWMGYDGASQDQISAMVGFMRANMGRLTEEGKGFWNEEILRYDIGNMELPDPVASPAALPPVSNSHVWKYEHHKPFTEWDGDISDLEALYVEGTPDGSTVGGITGGKLNITFPGTPPSYLDLGTYFAPGAVNSNTDAQFQVLSLFVNRSTFGACFLAGGAGSMQQYVFIYATADTDFTGTSKNSRYVYRLKLRSGWNTALAYELQGEQGDTTYYISAPLQGNERWVTF